MRRTTFQVMPADTMTVYSAQGSTFDAVVADMRKPPNFDLKMHWLACYVMLSRARSLEGLLILRLASRAELEAGPPEYMKDELRRLMDREKASTEDLLDYIRQLEIEVPTEIETGVLAANAVADEERRVRIHRGGLSGGLGKDDGRSIEVMCVTPKRRLSTKTAMSPASAPSSVAASTGGSARKRSCVAVVRSPSGSLPGSRSTLGRGAAASPT